MASSSTRTLEITAISGENLRLNHKPVRKNTFLIVKVSDSQTSCGSQTSTTTKIDENGGSNPSWNEKIVMELTPHSRFITIELHCRNSSKSDKIVGSAIIPISDFAGGFVPESYTRFLSYRLWDREGERNGIVNLSGRVVVKVASDVLGYHGCSTSAMVVGSSSFGGGEVVTGIPVWPYAYRPFSSSTLGHGRS